MLIAFFFLKDKKLMIKLTFQLSGSIQYLFLVLTVCTIMIYLQLCTHTGSKNKRQNSWGSFISHERCETSRYGGWSNGSQRDLHSLATQGSQEEFNI